MLIKNLGLKEFYDVNKMGPTKLNLQDGPECETDSSKKSNYSFTDCVPVLSLLVFPEIYLFLNE